MTYKREEFAHDTKDVKKKAKAKAKIELWRRKVREVEEVVKNYDEVEYKRRKKEEEARRKDQEKWDSQTKVRG
ncbi:hypothetical protein TrRE_jg10960, partial [Triparma retinervis]